MLSLVEIGEKQINPLIENRCVGKIRKKMFNYKKMFNLQEKKSLLTLKNILISPRGIFKSTNPKI